MPELVFFRQGEELLRIGLERRSLVIGRGEGSDVVIPDPRVSLRHVALHHDGTRCLLEDLSGQGTVVAGEPMKQGELPDGADLHLGRWRALFRQSSASGSGGLRTDVQPREAPEHTLPPAQVRVKQGHTEFVYPLGGDSFTIGTDPSNAVVVRDRFISNQHLRVKRSEAGIRVRDMNSTNGTFLEGLRLFEAELPLNTVLRVGETELIFEPVPQGSQVPAFHGIIGTSPAMRQLVESIQRVAPSSCVVSILGESGTGKELVARALHACSPRAGQPFIPLNCAALSPAVMESELFGHAKGAFTGAEAERKGAFLEAHGGTLFLDEVGELPLELQAKLLRVLESGEVKPVGADRPRQVNVRVVAATHRDLLSWVREGRFREDLYYRLGIMPLVLPPLRSRRGDIPALAEHFMRVHAPQGQVVKFTSAALERLKEHAWPGNVRELRNVVWRGLLVRKGLKLEARDLTFDEVQGAPVVPSVPALELPAGVTLEQMLERLERQLIESTLRRCHYNKERTAQVLGLARSSLFKRLKAWGFGQGEE
jgi:DNA-binding NtrC family response regulator